MVYYWLYDINNHLEPSWKTVGAGLVSSSTHRKCTSLREWLLEGLNNHEPSLYLGTVGEGRSWLAIGLQQMQSFCGVQTTEVFCEVTRGLPVRSITRQKGQKGKIGVLDITLLHCRARYRSRSLPPGYSFRFVRSLGRILLCHDNGVVVLDTPEVQPGAWGSMHLSFLYGPLEIFLDTVLRASADQLEVEPSNTVGMAGCIPVLVPEPGTPRCTVGSDDFALARALDPETANLAASARAPAAAAGARPFFRRSRSAVPAKAPLRPKGSSMEICLEQANLTLWHLEFYYILDPKERTKVGSL